MTAETDVCNEAVAEVAGVEEKREFKARSFQDLAKAEFNGIGNHDPEDSYVLVTDVGNPSADGKDDMAAMDGSPRYESSSPVELYPYGSPRELLGTEFDTRNGNPEGVNVDKLGNAEAGDAALDGSPRHESSGNSEGVNVGKRTLVNGSPDIQVISIVDGGGNQDNTVEEENRCSEELNDQHGKIDVVNGEDNPTLREGRIGYAGSTDENPSVKDGVVVGAEGSVRYEDEIQDKLAVGKFECKAESEIKKAEDSNRKIERSEEAEVANKLATRQHEGEAESEIIKADYSNGKIERSEVVNKLTIIKPKSEAESGINEAEDSSGKTERYEETEVANKLVVTKPECQAEPENKKVEDSNGKIQRYEEAEVANKQAGDKPESESESEIKEAEDSKGKIERSEEAEIVKFKYQDGKIGVMAVTGPNSVEENQESEDPNLGLVVDSGKEDGLKLEAVKDEAETALGKEALQAQKCDIDSENDIQNGLDEDKFVESAADCNDGTACGKVSEGRCEGVFSVSHVQGNNMYPDGAVNSREGNGETPQIDVSEREAEASGASQKQSVVHKNENKVQISNAETAEVVSSLQVDGSESESFGNEPNHLDSLEICTISGGSDSAIMTVVSIEMESISHGEELSADSEDDRNPHVSAVTLEPEAYDSSPVDQVAMTSEKDATNGSEVIDSFASDKGVSNAMPESADFKATMGGATRSHDETLLLAKNGDTESCSDTVTREGVSGVAVTKSFNYFVRLPRYSDEKLQEQIKIAEQEVNDRTTLRDSIQAQIQEIRAKTQNNGIDDEYAKGEDRSLKKLLKEKRMEIDSLQSVINKAKNATYIEDLNSRIKTIEHMIQHETLHLKEEKQLINEIKQLREQLFSCRCSKNDFQQAIEQREQAEERLKTLRKELGNLKGTASKAQTACDEAESKYNGEYKKVKELQAQFRAANDVRQEAYAKFLSLSKELSQKRKNFFKIKNDSAAATYYAFTDDRKALYRHCVNEVENFMELWNGDAEFRREYVRLNTRSILRRFGTLDGRSLGPDEKAIIPPSYVSERNGKVVSVQAKADSISKTPTIELKPETKIENVSSGIHSSKKETESKVRTVTTGGPAKSKQVNNLVPVSGMDDKKVVEVQEEPVKTKEELELIRKAEEIRREEAEANLKEQRRLEGIVKAKEACERKQRRDEKAQKKEELKAKKEAELKEKEREKKSRKKERRKAASTSTSAPMDLQEDASSITCVETSKEDASTKVSDGFTKKPKPSRVMVSKQNKTRSAPPPSLRYRNSRKWKQWMWLILISIAVLVLFWLGNLGVFSGVNSKLQGSAGL